MRLLLLVTRPQRRGAEVFAATLGRALRARGHEVGTVYLFDHSGESPLPLLDGDVVLPGTGRDRPGVDPRRLLRLAGAVRRHCPDLVQLNGGPTVLHGALLARLTPRRRWATVYRNIGDPDRWLVGRSRRALYRRVVGPALDGVVGVSSATLATVGRIYNSGIPQRRIPRAVDPQELQSRRAAAEVRAALDTPAAAPLLLFAGSLTMEKRVDRLLRLVAALRPDHPELRLWIAGEGPLRSRLEATARELGVAPAIRFLGPRDDLPDLLAAADLLVLASDSEGMPGVVLEAGAAGRPVVATAVGGVAECVLPEETALLVPPHDEAGLATAVTALLADPNRRRVMGGRAAAWVAERFSIDTIAGEYEEFYHQVLARRREGLR
ncbi:MAG TPA: glycosyltransferase family 4 protein [Thermoanaerobaculia bacterium]|nr:glycosyltransferase family 4 protein [Thermoanaerobaculia bacterium]